jgi:hypothetical protein
MKLSNKLIIGCVLSATLAQGSDKISSLDRMMYTINPKIAVKGPIFKDKAEQSEKDLYVSNVVSIILKEADKKAKKYLEAGDTKAYYAFLTLALTVPMHEGLYIQFRNIDENVCRPAANSGELLQKGSADTYKNFVDYLKTGPDAFLPNCEELANETSSTQIIRGGDGSDLSMMQVSLRWHADDFLANKKYQSVEESLSYGMGLLISGFDPVYRNIDQYSCLFEKHGFFGKKTISYINIIRGVWAGKYNSGSIDKTCRFNESGAYKKFDANFLGHLNKILNYSETIEVDLVGKFTLNELENNAIKEVVGNLQSENYNHEALDKLLAR